MAYTGTALYVDLKDESIRKEEISEETFRKYLGSRGINAKILWDGLKKGADPLGEENLLIFGPGLLNGTMAPSSGRLSVTCKGPATGLYLKTSVGGHFGTELRLAGYDILVFERISKSTVYLYIEDEKVEIRDADDLWGLDVRETDILLKKRHGDCQVAAIGPGGENLVKFASIMCSIYNAAGRGGAGAVMGSKRLKAVAVKGSGGIKIAQPKSFMEEAQKIRKDLSMDPTVVGLYDYGTSGSLETINEVGALPTHNFKTGYFKDAHKISGQYLVEGGYLRHRVGCSACTISCHRYSEVKNEKDEIVSYTGGPEYETFSALGSGCGVSDTEAVIKANELCNLYSMDTISTGSLIQWAMECYEKGVLTAEDIGFSLNWGDGEAMIKMTELIAKRDGFGDILANGVKKAAEIVGEDSWKWAIEAKGLEQSRVETRSAKSYALAFATNPRGPDHLMTEPIAEFGITDEMKDLVKEITGDERNATPYITDKRAEIIRWHEDCYAVTDSLGFCVFTSTAAYGVKPGNMALMYSYATGIPISEEELMRTGRRIVTLEKCFNVREGATRKDDVLPWRLMNEEPEASPEGSRNSQEELDMMLDEYYRLHGWDLDTSIPTRETLEYLDLKDVADELGFE